MGVRPLQLREWWGLGHFRVPRRVTRSVGNELFELDGKPALDLYERYLGEEADGLPGTGLLYPLKVWTRSARCTTWSAPFLRLIGNPLHDFRRDIPQGSKAQLMRGEFTRCRRRH